MRCIRPYCKNTATTFGPYCGGICDDHAKQELKEGVMEWQDIWPQHYARLEKQDG